MHKLTFQGRLFTQNELVRNIIYDKTQITSSESILRSDIASVLRNKKQHIAILLDDVDLAGVKGESTINYENTWALIAGAFNITHKFQEISAIVSVRSDVWHTMRYRRLGSDKRDKITNVFLLENTDADMHEILYRRIYNALGTEFSGPKDAAMHHFFEGKVILPGETHATRPWDSWLCKQARERPRDLVQLVMLFIKTAKEKKMSKITNAILPETITSYYKQRLANMADEFCNICPDIEFICKQFKKKEFSYDEILTFLKKLPSAKSIQIDGNTLSPEKIDDAIKILHVLHMANFLNPRCTDASMPKGYRHILYTNNEDIITVENTTNLSRMRYEVHPVFHSMIAAQKEGMLLHR